MVTMVNPTGLIMLDVSEERATTLETRGWRRHSVPPVPEPVSEDAESIGEPVRPRTYDPKAVWVEYAVASGALTVDEAEALTKQQLVERLEH